MNHNLLNQIRVTQASLREAAGDALEETEHAHLVVLVRLTMEFAAYMDSGDGSAPNENRRYVNESTFAGIDSFRVVMNAYRVLAGTVPSIVKWTDFHWPAFRQQFQSLYRELAQPAAFEKRCRVLLDLFTLQILFAGITYAS